MGHAVAAALVASATVLLPCGCVEEFSVGGRIAVGHQVARPLPPEHRVAGDAPGCAAEVDLALAGIEEERGVIEPPLLATPTRERVAEDGVGALDVQPVILVGRLLVGVSRRDLHAVDADLVVEEVEDSTNGARVVLVEEGRVGGPPEAALLGSWVCGG